MAQQRFYIGNIAKQLGISPKTIRWYEAQGLIKEPSRTESGYRYYTGEDQDRLRFIRKALAFGFSSKEIKDILDLRAHGQHPCDLVLSLLDKKIMDLHSQIKLLTAFEQELKQLQKSWREKSTLEKQSNATICGCIEHAEEPREVPNKRRKHG